MDETRINILCGYYVASNWLKMCFTSLLTGLHFKQKTGRVEVIPYYLSQN